MNRGELGRGEERWAEMQAGRRVIFWPLFPSTVQHWRRQAAAEFRYLFPGVDLTGHGDLDHKEGHVALYYPRILLGPDCPAASHTARPWRWDRKVLCTDMIGWGGAFSDGRSRRSEPHSQATVAKWQSAFIAASKLMSCRGGPKTLTHSQSRRKGAGSCQ